MKRNLLFLFFCICTFYIQAQPRFDLARNRFVSLGIQFNVANYFGDLNPKTNALSTEFSFTRPSFGIQLANKLNKNLSWRASLVWARLQGDDFVAADPNDDLAVFRYARNLQFRNSIIEFSPVLMMDIIPNRGRFFYRKFVSPYIFAGVSFLYSNPKGKVSDSYTGPEAGDWVLLRPLQTEGKKYSAIQVAIPFGGGLRFRVLDRLDVSVEVGIRYSLSDYLDDVSGNYANPEDLDGDLARVMSNRSAEVNATVNGEPRDFTRLTQVLGTPIILTTTDGGNYPTFPGYGQNFDIRGHKDKDVYVLSGLQINYILNIKRYRPLRPGL